MEAARWGMENRGVRCDGRGHESMGQCCRLWPTDILHEEGLRGD